MRILILVIILLLPSYLLSEWEWEMLMEDVYGITVYEGVIYIGTDDGIKKSTDNGDTWENFALNSIFIFQIEVKNNNIYALGRVLEEDKFYFSSDFGNNWTLLSIPDENRILEYIVIKNDIIYALSLTRFYISLDNGATWERKLKSPHKGLVSIGIDDSGYIYLGTVGALEYYYLIYVSSDDGETWETKVNGINLFARETSVLQIYIHGDSVFAVTYGGVYLSTNQGYYWYEVSDINAIKFLIYKDLMFVGNDFALYYSLFGSNEMLNSGLKEFIREIKVNETTNTIFALGNHYIPGKGYSPVSLYRASLDHVTSVDDSKPYGNKLTIFPNPSSDILHIQTTALTTRTELTDILGRTVFKQSGNVEQISTAGLAPGLYLLKLYTAGGEVLTEKVVVR